MIVLYIVNPPISTTPKEKSAMIIGMVNPMCSCESAHFPLDLPRIDPLSQHLRLRLNLFVVLSWWLRGNGYSIYHNEVDSRS